MVVVAKGFYLFRDTLSQGRGNPALLLAVNYQRALIQRVAAEEWVRLHD